MRAAIVGGVRTPFVKAGGVFSKYSALDLGKHVVTSCVQRLGLNPSMIQELFFGTVLLDPRIPNLAREIILRSGLPKTISGHFISNNCITGIVAANAAREGIVSGRITCALAGGSESMSQPTLTYPSSGEKFFLRLNRAKSSLAKLQVASSFRPGFLAPQAPSPKEPSTNLTMGQHCELMAQQMGIAREEQDKVAYCSHMSASEAAKSGFLAKQIEALGDIAADNLVRSETTLEKLAVLPAVFDRTPAGTISAGNSSALTDGASVVCLIEEQSARSQGLPILGFLDGVECSSLPPGDGLLMAPALAVPRLLARHGLHIDQIDLFEVHEAFGAQVLCNMQAWEKGWSLYPDLSPIGALPPEKVNVRGGSIALGHPFAATGGRLLLNICQALEERGARHGIISVCAAGGAAAAVLVSRY